PGLRSAVRLSASRRWPKAIAPPFLTKVEQVFPLLRVLVMTLDAIAFQALNGVAAASGLFLVGAGLSLIFGVTRIVNMAHGSLYMVGIYLAYAIATVIGSGWGYWGGIVGAALGVAALGAVIEIVLLRRIYHVPE